MIKEFNNKITNMMQFFIYMKRVLKFEIKFVFFGKFSLKKKHLFSFTILINYSIHSITKYSINALHQLLTLEIHSYFT